MADDQTKVIVGRFGAPHGVKGEIKVFPFTEQSSAILDYQPWYLQKDGAWLELKIKHTRATEKYILVTIEGCSDRTLAQQQYTNCDIYTERQNLPRLAHEDEVYWADLEGLTVETISGEVLGRIIGLFETGANDVMIVKGDSKQEHLIPYIDQVICQVDLTLGKVTVDWDVNF